MRILADGADALAGPNTTHSNYTPSCPGGKIVGKPWLHAISASSVFDIVAELPSEPCHEQVWYDSPQSLPLKYGWLGRNGFGGFGIWDAEMVASVKGYIGPGSGYARCLFVQYGYSWENLRSGTAICSSAYLMILEFTKTCKTVIYDNDVIYC